MTEVTPGGPAAKAGLRGDSNAAKLNSLSQSADPYALLKGNGDIIVGIDGKQVSSIEQLTQDINQDQPGQTVVLTVLRAGKTLHVRVTLGTWPSSQNP
ncbi:PDZ domain-containing protein [Alicyclobacillus sendaiensis]|uniref:PDZ domain-containing protein n=1 Tax=Alicyclobacillus sendaiensis TaxID=192387 RepID=UPI0026F4514E|nr:PDZ domain-containing protein [Alicyclobacillus sendaiensis]